jgi:hypothetical protein
MKIRDKRIVTQMLVLLLLSSILSSVISGGFGQESIFEEYPKDQQTKQRIDTSNIEQDIIFLDYNNNTEDTKLDDEDFSISLYPKNPTGGWMYVNFSSKRYDDYSRRYYVS